MTDDQGPTMVIEPDRKLLKRTDMSCTSPSPLMKGITMINDIGSLVGDLAAHRNLSAQCDEKRASQDVTDTEAELERLRVNQFLDELVIEELIDEATRPSNLPDEDYDGDTMDAFGDDRHDAIDALITAVDKDTPFAVDGVVVALAWELLDRTGEGEFLTIFANARAQVESNRAAAAWMRSAWPQW